MAHLDPAEGDAETDIRDELQDILCNRDFSSEGNFYHSSILSNPPNPYLTIEGLGVLGLPIGERDVKAIITVCSISGLPRRGKQATAKDSNSGKIWEVEAGKISFRNSAWQDYVDTTLSSLLCKSLGVHIEASQVKMDLGKLLIYETGAYLLPHHETRTRTTEQVFGTAIILLPSDYTGGQIVISHKSSAKTINFANNSLFSTALLAWYADSKYEVKPIQSGYLVALSYNLVHVPKHSGAPLPSLPDMTDSVEQLRNVLKKWKNMKDGTPSFIAYLLKDQYDNLKQGLNVLEGLDFRRATWISYAAKEAGFGVYVASLRHKKTGNLFDTDDYGYRPYHLRTYDSDSDDGSVYMTEYHTETSMISELVDLHSCMPIFDSGARMSVDAKCLIPDNAFREENPDEKSTDDHGGCRLVYRYYRTALVLMDENKADDILYKLEGAPYALRMLKKSNNISPTAYDRLWARRLLTTTVKKDYFFEDTSEEEALDTANAPSPSRGYYIRTVLEFALKWKDVQLWISAARHPSCTLGMVDSKFPIGILEFEDMRPSFEALLERSASLNQKMKFLSKFSPKGASHRDDKTTNWYQQEAMKILSSYSSTEVRDIPELLSIIQHYGLQAFQNFVMPNLVESENYSFWMAFVKALWEKRAAILEQELSLVPPPLSASPFNTSREVLTINTIVKRGLEIASTQWNYIETKDCYGNPCLFTGRPINVRRGVNLDRIIEVVEQAIVVSELGVCKTLFDDILTNNCYATFQKSKEIFSPLLCRLRELLGRTDLDVFQFPFIDFIKSFVGLYLHDVLGKKEELSGARVRKIGCLENCWYCKLLDDFLTDPTKNTALLRAPKARRLHLQDRANNAKDLVTYVVVKSGSPHGIQLTKLPSVIEESTWPSRQNAARIFLDSIGSANAIARIMGDRLVDVTNALYGLRPYDPTSPSTTTSMATPTTMITTQTSNGQSYAPSWVANTTQLTPSVSASNTAGPRTASAVGFSQHVVFKKRRT